MTAEKLHPTQTKVLLQLNALSPEPCHRNQARYKIKLRNAGYRLVYQVKDRDLLVLVAAAGKRERNEVYKAAERRKSD